MRTRSDPKPKQSEAELCAEFIRWVQANSDWTAYPETGGWDILFAAPDGAQLGVQAKLSFNATLVRQVLPERLAYGNPLIGPDYRAVLLPKTKCRDVRDACEAMGVICFEVEFRSKRMYRPGSLNRERWQVWPMDRRVELPDYVPDVSAGASAPVRLTKWKVAALRIIAILEIQGHVTRADFRRDGINIDYRRWIGPGGWLELRDGVYVRGSRLVFDQQHQTVYARILEEMRAELTKPANP